MKISIQVDLDQSEVPLATELLNTLRYDMAAHRMYTYVTGHWERKAIITSQLPISMLCDGGPSEYLPTRVSDGQANAAGQ